MPPRYTIRQVVGTYRRKAFGTHNEDGSDRRPPYPADAIVAFYGTLELAEEQPIRGRFESEALLRVLLTGPDNHGRRFARQVPYLLAQGDLVRDGAALVVEGWELLQEGDVTIAERVQRFRSRRRKGDPVGNGPGNGPSNGEGNEEPSRATRPARNAVDSVTDSVDGFGDGAGGARDSLDRYHELTGFRPWGQFSGDALRGAANDYGDAAVLVALDAEYAVDTDRNTLLRRTQARLARDAERATRAPRASRARPRLVDDAEKQAVLRDLYAAAPDVPVETA
jgi:hypothetical protein